MSSYMDLSFTGSSHRNHAELGGNKWMRQLQLQRDHPGTASGLGHQPLLGQVPLKRGMVVFLLVLRTVMLLAVW